MLSTLKKGSELLINHMEETNNYQYQKGTHLTLYGNDVYSRLFTAAIAFTLIISLPTIIDITTSLLYLHTLEELQQPIEYARLLLLIVLVIPNIFIYFEVIPAIVIDLVMFCQFVCLFYVLVYRIYTLSSPTTTITTLSTSALSSAAPRTTGQQQQKKNSSTHAYPLQDLFVFCIFTLISAFLYKLSTHDVISGRNAWKAIYTTCLLLLQVITCFKLKPWFNFTVQITKVVKNHLLLQNKTAFYAVMMGIGICTAMTLAHVATYKWDYIYFPKTSGSYIALEWLFCGALLFWTSVRNFEIRKTELATANQLAYNRKMTRSISHEIRTPLNTAFMALELLISSLTQQQQLELQQCKSMSRSIDVMDPDGNADNSISTRPIYHTPSSDSGKKQLIGGNSTTSNLLEIAESIKEGCEIALNILNQLLTFEKLSAGMLQLENKVITVNQLLDSNMKLFKMQAQQCGITFKLDNTSLDMAMLSVYVDEHKMNQVLRNLLSNAMKFTPRGGVVEVKLQWIPASEREEAIAQLTSTRIKLNPTINESKDEENSRSISSRPLLSTKMRGSLKIVTELLKRSKSDDVIPITLQTNVPTHHPISGMKESGTILISVVDSGPGVNEDDQKKLFQEYVQINPGELQKGQGTGLGLSISKSIVHLHGGNIGMTSDGVGKGSTFFVELPVYHKTRDDGISGLYDSVMDHSRIFATSARMLKRSGSKLSLSLGSTSRSRSTGAANNSVNNSISGQHNKMTTPMKALERVESFLSLGSAAKLKRLKSYSASDKPGNTDNSLAVPANPTGDTNQPSVDHLDRLENAATSDIEQGVTVRAKPLSSTVSAVDTHKKEDESVAVTDYLRTMFGAKTNKVVPSSLVADNAITSGENDKTSPSLPAPSTIPSAAAQPMSSLEDRFNKAITRSRSQDPTDINDRRTVGLQVGISSKISSKKPNNRNRMSFLTQPSKAYRILVVDDSTPNRKMLNRLLSREHHIVTEASNGEEAVELISALIRNRSNAMKLNEALTDKILCNNNEYTTREFNQPTDTETSVTVTTSSVSLAVNALRPDSHGPMELACTTTDLNGKVEIPPMFDLILMDYYMPHMNGPDAVALIRQLGYTGVILGVSGAMDDDVHHFIDLGADLVLCKPITLTALWKALRGTAFFEDHE